MHVYRQGAQPGHAVTGSALGRGLRALGGCHRIAQNTYKYNKYLQFILVFLVPTLWSNNKIIFVMFHPRKSGNAEKIILIACSYLFQPHIYTLVTPIGSS